MTNHPERPYDPGMPSTVQDKLYGRRGGGWLPAGYQEHREDRHCPVCDGLLTVGQDIHAACRPVDAQLFPDV